MMRVRFYQLGKFQLAKYWNHPTNYCLRSSALFKNYSGIFCLYVRTSVGVAGQSGGDIVKVHCGQFVLKFNDNDVNVVVK